ncbi:MAG: tRNA pseudouridine(38-40) synthase TruA [Akkermansiaceae bacterium]
MRLKLTIAYDGRPFAGWATQPNGNTIQDLIETAIVAVGKSSEVRIHGSGRTDAGVHAAGQIAHFDAPDGLQMNPYNWVPALNTKLPATVRILDCQEVAEDFHARFSARAKTYTYDLCLSPVLPPLLAGLAWHLPRQLDPETLAAALQLYLGEHNFQAFSAKRGNETEETDYSRTITESSLTTTDTGYRITFQGNGFLYKMVRILTGTAVQAAQGRMRLDEVSALLDQADGLPHGRSRHCAPADGLVLSQVEYPPTK